jgi:leucyl aminopeptidase
VMNPVRVVDERPADVVSCMPMDDALEPADDSELSEEGRRFCRLAGFTGRPGETCLLSEPGRGMILAVGTGPRRALSMGEVSDVIASAVRRMRQGDLPLALDYRWLASTGSPAAVGEAVASSAVAASYEVGRTAADGPRSDMLLIVADGAGPELQRGVRRGQAIGEAVNLVRDLVNEPAVTMTPSRFADIAGDVAASRGLSIRTWGPDEITAAGLGGVAAVAAGSHEPPRFIRLDYPGSRASREGRNVRLGRPEPQVRGRHGHDENRHGRRRNCAGRHVSAGRAGRDRARPGLPATR